ncbi:MAG: ATP-binding cassette domain-containing protein, partial [Proteobacteria bacterium]|nr:ATP-binding cassette domain-containing protein [Pseudomonadota bacterium]
MPSFASAVATIEVPEVATRARREEAPTMSSAVPAASGALERSEKATVERLKAIDLAIGQAEKQFGRGAIMRLGDGAAKMQVEAIPTGALALDLALGIGGLPRGRVGSVAGFGQSRRFEPVDRPMDRSGSFPPGDLSFCPFAGPVGRERFFGGGLGGSPAERVGGRGAGVGRLSCGALGEPEAHMSMPLLQIRALRKEYRLQGRAPLEILHGIDFQLQSGECRPVCGPSGAGKSTLLHILGGLESADGGEMSWKGESMKGWSRSQWAVWRRMAVGFVFQSYHLISELTVEENVRLPAMLAGVQVGERWEDLLDQVGMTLRRDHLPGE